MVSKTGSVVQTKRRRAVMPSANRKEFLANTMSNVEPAFELEPDFLEPEFALPVGDPFFVVLKTFVVLITFVVVFVAVVFLVVVFLVYVIVLVVLIFLVDVVLFYIGRLYRVRCFNFFCRLFGGCDLFYVGRFRRSRSSCNFRFCSC